MATLAQHLFRAGQRRSARDDISIRTVIWRLTPPQGEAVDALVVNLSRFGFMAHTALPPLDGCLIAVDLPEVGEIRARTVWSMEGRLGAEFLTPITADDYAALLAGLSIEPFG